MQTKHNTTAVPGNEGRRAGATEREQKAARRRARAQRMYELHTVEGLTLEETAARFGVSRERVRQVLEREFALHGVQPAVTVRRRAKRDEARRRRRQQAEQEAEKILRAWRGGEHPRKIAQTLHFSERNVREVIGERATDADRAARGKTQREAGAARRSELAAPRRRIGAAIRAAREKTGLSRRALAKRCGMATRDIGAVERGEARLGVKALGLITELDLSGGDLMARARGDGDAGYNERLGAAIGRLRRARGMTGTALARAAGVDRAHLARIERGTRAAGWQTVLSVAQALEISAADLARETEWPDGDGAQTAMRAHGTPTVGDLGRGLWRAREKRGMSRPLLARAAEVHTSTVHKIEHDERDATWPTICRLAEGMGGTAATLLSEIEREQQAQRRSARPVHVRSERGAIDVAPTHLHTERA